MSSAFSVVGEGVLVLTFPSLARAGALAVVSTRVGGVSRDPFGTLNLSEGSGDDPAHVAENRRRLLQGLGLGNRRLIRGRQVHGTGVAVVDASSPPEIPATDGLVTGDEGVALAVTVADCVPVFLVAPDLPAVALVHAGWRGTLGGVGLVALEKLLALGARPERLLAAVGPGAGGTSYEVGEDVIGALLRAYPFAAPYARGPSPAGTYRLDLMGLNAELLHRQGVPPNQIAVAPYTTIDHPALFFSYRRDGPKSGRMWALLALVRRSPECGV